MPARHWTRAEDAAIRAACARTRATGMVEEDTDGSRQRKLQAEPDAADR